MPSARDTLISLEKKFWQALVDEDADTAIELLSEPALMVTSHGTMKFDHEQYRKMAEQGPVLVSGFELSDMNVVFPNETTAILSYRVKQRLTPRGKNESTTEEVNDTSTWVKNGDRWQCVMHTETPAAASNARH